MYKLTAGSLIRKQLGFAHDMEGNQIRARVISGAVCLLVLAVVGGSPAASGAPDAPPGPTSRTTDDVVVAVESALLDVTYACLVETNAVPVGTVSSAVVGAITDAGVSAAPTEVIDATAACGLQAASLVHQIVVANAGDAVEGAAEAENLASATLAGEVAFESPEDAGVAPQSSASLAAVTADQWINGMNQKQDILMDFFITGYGDPGYYNWSSDECSAPLVGNSPWGSRGRVADTTSATQPQGRRVPLPQLQHVEPAQQGCHGSQLPR